MASFAGAVARSVSGAGPRCEFTLVGPIDQWTHCRRPMLLASLSFATSALGVSLRDPVVSELSRLGYGRVRGVTQLNSGGGERGLRTSHRRYDTDEGPVFCKTSPLACAAQAFEAEAASLRALRSATLGSGLVRMPKPIATGAMPLGGEYAARFA
jgi:hypothetical protein